jgi:glutamate--cysteine ligase
MEYGRKHYAHMGATVNSKHLRSVVDFIAAGSLLRQDYSFGVEIEHLPVRNGTGEAVDLYAQNGVEDFLFAIRRHFDPEKETWENGHLLGLTRPGLDVSTEPGAQIETALGPSKSVEEVEKFYAQFRQIADPVLARLNFRLVNYGYQPHSSWKDVRSLPTARYRNMREYFGTIGSYGIPVMHCSASTQVSIDFSNEKDCIAKMRLGSVLGPVLAWFFRNAPYFEGTRNTMPLLRQEMWDRTDPQRTGLTPGLFHERFGWEDYAADVLSTPLLIANMEGTPEYEGSRHTFIAWRENANSIYPDRELNEFEIKHILSTHFNDVRLKNFLEFRHWDSLPIERVSKLVSIIDNLFYDPVQLERLTWFFSGVGEADVVAAKAMIQAQGGAAHPYGKSMEEWRDFLSLTDVGSEIAGDAQHPEIVQEWAPSVSPVPRRQPVRWRP